MRPFIVRASRLYRIVSCFFLLLFFVAGQVKAVDVPLFPVLPPLAPGDQFGDAIATLGDDILVGATGANSGAGTAYLWDSSATTWWEIPNPAPSLGDHFAEAVAISDDYIVIGGDWDNGSNGGAFVFDTATRTLLSPLNHIPSFPDHFGQSVAVLGDTVIVSAHFENFEAGAVYLFDATTGNKLHALDHTPVAGDRFGHCVAAADGKIIVTASGQNFGLGKGYIFDAASGDLLNTFQKATPDVADEFGASPGGIALSGNNIIVGAYEDDAGAWNAGGVYVFDVTTGGNEVLHIPNPYPDAQDHFGAAVAAVGNSILIGATDDGTDTVSGAGRAYLFDGAALMNTYESTDAVNGGFFGDAVGATGDTVLIGAWGEFGMAGALHSSPVPEPSTLLLLSMGVLGFLAYAYRRHKRR